MAGTSPALSCLADCLKAVGRAVSRYGADARIGQVEADQPCFVGGQPIQQVSPRYHGLLGHVVGDRTPLRMRE
jgi:hypothetical protein